MVALTGGPEGHALIRRAARIAARSGGDLLAVHSPRGRQHADPTGINDKPMTTYLAELSRLAGW
jgi:two-component system sensor histidine kinase KdpD